MWKTSQRFPSCPRMSHERISHAQGQAQDVWDFDGIRRHHIRRGLQLTPAEHLRWLEETVRVAPSFSLPRQTARARRLRRRHRLLKDLNRTGRGSSRGEMLLQTRHHPSRNPHSQSSKISIRNPVYWCFKRPGTNSPDTYFAVSTTEQKTGKSKDLWPKGN